MSIIEKAVDKLMKNDGEKPSKNNNDASTIEKALTEEQLDEASIPSKSVKTSEQKTERKPVYKNKKTVSRKQSSKDFDEKREDLSKTIETEKPDILIGELEVEGILSSKEGRTRSAEEYRLIKRPILVKAFDKSANQINSQHQNLIMLTSSVAGEGKTFTSLNLSISIAMEMDRTVLLVDTDLAKPGLSRLLGVSDQPGLTDCLLNGKADVGDFLKKTDIPKLTILPSGKPNDRSTELLSSQAMNKLLDELAERYPDRIVIFDTPPLLATSEAGVLARQMGQICMVVESSSTPQYMVKEALSHLENTENVSLVLNKVKPDLFSSGYGYAYSYGYGYGYGEK